MRYVSRLLPVGGVRISLAAFFVCAACAVASVAAGYATYIGDAYQYSVSAIASDANGNTYVTGSRAVAVSASGQGWLNDIFVSKLDPDGNLTLLATLSGKGSDQAFGIALDPSGNIYIAGSTSSPDFPLYHPLQSTACQGSETGFLVKLSADGTILYSTYLGGTTGISTMNAVVADAGGNAYVTVKRSPRITSTQRDYRQTLRAWAPAGFPPRSSPKFLQAVTSLCGMAACEPENRQMPLATHNGTPGPSSSGGFPPCSRVQSTNTSG